MTPRVRRTFWALLAIAVVATGALSRALAARPGPATGLVVAASALIAASAMSLTLRILVGIRRHPSRRDDTAGGPILSGRDVSADRRRRGGTDGRRQAGNDAEGLAHAAPGESRSSAVNPAATIRIHPGC